MATTSPLQAIPLPEATDADNVPFAFSQAVGPIESRLVMRFATTTARDAAITSPTEGMLAYITGDDVYTAYTGAGWVEIGRLGAWQSFTPTWTGSTTNPVIGNGTLAGWYTRIGRTIHFRIHITTGSTTTYGSGAYRFALPVAAAPILAGAGGVVGSGAVHDTSTSSRFLYFGLFFSASVIQLVNSTSVAVDSTNPMTFANGDTIAITGTYEAAA